MQAYIGQIVPHYINSDIHNISLRIYFSGCDFRCVYCNVPELLTFNEQHLIDIKEIKKEIRINHTFIKSIFFTGGEPCLQKQALIHLAQFSKLLGLRVAIDTNGSKPDVLLTLLEHRLVDTIYLDIKTPFSSKIFEKVTQSQTFFISAEQLLKKIEESLKILQQYQKQCEVVVITPILPNLMYRKEDLLSIAAMIQGIASRWVLRRFKNDAPTFNKQYSKIQMPSFDFVETLKETIEKKYPTLTLEVD